MPTTPTISPTLSEVLNHRVPDPRQAASGKVAGFRAPVADARRMRILQRTERELAALLAKATKAGREGQRKGG